MKVLRNWKNWLFPGLTLLIVAGLAVLPLWLSASQDGRLADVVHAEELGEDSNFPARPPELPGRLWLLVQRNSMPENLTIVDQELEGTELDRASGQARTELRRLEETGVLPEGFTESLESFNGNRVYLRDQSDLSSAAFLEMNAYSQKRSAGLWAYLDGESGRILALETYSEYFEKHSLDVEASGRAFLDGLGVEYEPLAAAKADAKFGEALFRLPDSKALYLIQQQWGTVQIRPEADWELLNTLIQEGETVGASVYDALGYDG